MSVERMTACDTMLRLRPNCERSIGRMKMIPMRIAIP